MSAIAENGQSEQIARDTSTAKKINKLFSSSKTRHDGWRLLNSFLPRCPDECLLQFCVSWMQNCCKIDGSVKNKEYAITLLGNLFKMSKNYQELKKSVSFFITTQYFDFFFKYFLDSQPGWDCTKNCLLYYRGACGAFQDGLQKHLTQEVNKGSKIPVNIAECFALLPCAGGGGNDGVNYKRNWKTQFLKMLAICHSILNELYEDAEELKLQEYETPEHTYQLPDQARTAKYLVTLLHNHTTVLNCMLLNQYPAPKTIPPDLIFQLVCRGLALSPKSLEGRRTSKLIALREALPYVHRVFLSLLKAAIVACKNLLYPYSHLVCKLVKQVLEWSDEDSCYPGDDPLVELRVCAYETLCNWLTVARNGSCVENISGAVISSAVSDVVTKKAVVFLKAKRQSKDGKQKTSRRMDATPDSRLCYPALKCLQFLLKFAGVSLKPEEHKFLQEMVVELLLEIQKTPSGSLAQPFDSPRCRRELYALLLELVHQPCTKWPPPTHFALALFARGVNDCSPDISSLCSAGLNLTTIIIHPHYDNGGFPTLEPSDGRDFTAPNITWTEEPMEDVGGGDISRSLPPTGLSVGGDSLEGAALEKNGDSSSVASDPEEKISNASEEIGFSNSEDSRTTIPFSKETEKEVGDEEDEERIEVVDLVEVEEEPVKVEQTKETREELEETKKEEQKEANETKDTKETQETETPEEPEKPQNEEGPSPKKRKIAPTEVETPAKEERIKTPPIVRESKGKGDRRSDDLDSPREPLTPAENHPKKRYFLRSKTKGSGEESEEGGVKSESSPDSGKSTPMRGLAQSTPMTNTPTRRKKRPLSRMTTSNTEGEPKGGEKNGHEDDIDEENLKAAFDDSLAD